MTCACALGSGSPDDGHSDEGGFWAQTKDRGILQVLRERITKPVMPSTDNGEIWYPLNYSIIPSVTLIKHSDLGMLRVQVGGLSKRTARYNDYMRVLLFMVGHYSLEPQSSQEQAIVAAVRRLSHERGPLALHPRRR